MTTELRKNTGSTYFGEIENRNLFNDMTCLFLFKIQVSGILIFIIFVIFIILLILFWEP